MVDEQRVTTGIVVAGMAAWGVLGVVCVVLAIASAWCGCARYVGPPLEFSLRVGADGGAADAGGDR